MMDLHSKTETKKTRSVLAGGKELKSRRSGSKLGTKMAATTRAGGMPPAKKPTCKDVAGKLDQSVNPFAPKKVEPLLKTVLDAYLHKVKYDPARCSKLAQDMCSVIKSKTKEFNFENYKLVVQVYVGQDSDQSVQLASRCLWNADIDAFASATYRNNSLYGIAVVYGIRVE